MLVAALAQRGFAVLADAVVPLAIQGAQVMVQPAMAEVALWRESARRLGFDSADWKPVRQGLERYYVPGLRAESSPQPLRALYILGVHNQSTVRSTRLRGRERFLLVTQFVFNRTLAELPATRERQFQAIAALITAVPVSNLQRPEAMWSVDELVAVIQGDLSQ
jgi:hypothetical protein